MIYDRNGVVVARNVSSFTASIRPTDLPRDRTARTDVFARLGSIIEMSPDEIGKLVEPGRVDPFLLTRIKSPITRERALILEEQHTRLPGVVVQFTPVREYPVGLLFGQLLGYTGPIPPNQVDARVASGYGPDEFIGLSGVESSFEDELRGTAGRQQVEVDAMGRVTNVIETLAPTIPGANVVLTIDGSLQELASASLSRGMNRAKSQQGSLVAMDPSTGEILAMVSLPGYDNNLFATGISQAEYSRLANDVWRPLFTHAIGGQVPPGSTFKMVTAAPHCRNGLSRRPRMSRAPGRLREMASNSATGRFKVTGQSTRGRRSESRATSISIPSPEGIPTPVFRDLELHAWQPMPGRSGLARRLVFDFPGNLPVFFRRRSGSAKRRVSRGTSVTSTTSVLVRETFWRPRCSSHR